MPVGPLSHHLDSDALELLHTQYLGLSGMYLIGRQGVVGH